MVVIEPVLVVDEQLEAIPKSKPTTKNEVSPEPSSAHTSSTMENSDIHNKNALGYVSDGYETASETELDHDDDAVKEGKIDVSETQSGESHSEPVVSIPSSKGISEEETLEAKQQIPSSEELVDEKVLAEANSAKLEGNTLFKDGLYEEALLKYNLALELVPNLPASAEIRSVFHANRAACFSKLGKFDETVKECSKALELNPSYIKVLLRRAEAHEKLENFDEAIGDWKKILECDPSNYQARKNVIRLQPMADAKREKLKEEMIGKLKEMGNSILGRFGMSVDNFKAVQDPNTGSYSISMQR
jgi:tetratricopeptide (TPR) repeat protein